MQIATAQIGLAYLANKLCLHTPRADCNAIPHVTPSFLSKLCLHTPRADCNPQYVDVVYTYTALCLHTPRADCNARCADLGLCCSFASTRPVQIATRRSVRTAPNLVFASTRPVQIATLHAAASELGCTPLPPHAPCRLQRQLATELGNVETLCLHTPRADCNGSGCAHHEESMLCLHTPRADCNTMSQ